MINYGIALENELKKIKNSGLRPALLLHACCAPCSSYVLEYLHSYFDISLYYYNPNISPVSEFEFRAAELRRLVTEMGFENIAVAVEEYENEEFFQMAKGMEELPEGGERCFKCYALRLEKTAEYAKNNGFDYFTTTLTISPYKNAAVLNEIGGELAEKYGVKYLFSDFKKNNGYKRSCELSRKYSLYRQNYCGCVYSKAQR